MISPTDGHLGTSGGIGNFVERFCPSPPSPRPKVNLCNLCNSCNLCDSCKLCNSCNLRNSCNSCKLCNSRNSCHPKAKGGKLRAAAERVPPSSRPRRAAAPKALSYSYEDITDSE